MPEFSKTLEHLTAAIHLYMTFLNLRLHQPLRVAPVMEARISDNVWSVQELSTSDEE